MRGGWRNEEARTAYAELAAKLGAPDPPTMCAIWSTGVQPWLRHCLSDRRRIRCAIEGEEAEVANVTSCLRVHLEPRDVAALLSVSSAFVYDALQKELCIRTGTVLQNTQHAILALRMLETKSTHYFMPTPNDLRRIRLEFPRYQEAIEALTLLARQHHERFASALHDRHCASFGPETPSL